MCVALPASGPSFTRSDYPSPLDSMSHSSFSELKTRTMAIICRLSQSIYIKVVLFLLSVCMMAFFLYEFIQKVRGSGWRASLVEGVVAVGSVAKIFSTASHYQWIRLGCLQTPLSVVGDIGRGVDALRRVIKGCYQFIYVTKESSCCEGRIATALKITLAFIGLFSALFSLYTLLSFHPIMLMICDLVWTAIPLLSILLDCATVGLCSLGGRVSALSGCWLNFGWSNGGEALEQAI